jgi:hypothetical protein
MRVVAIPAPLTAAPFATVIVGVELLATEVARAGRVGFAIVAIDQEGKTRARAQFSTNFANAQRTASGWTRTGSRIDVPPGDYQIRVAADGGSGLRGSVFTEVSVPRFDAELGVGGLSLGAPSATAVTEADRLRGVLSFVPLATNEVAPGAALSAQLPIKVSSKASSSSLTITVTLAHADGTTVSLDRSQASGREYAATAGKIYRVALPQALAAGTYRIVVETALGRTRVARELGFSVVSPQ